MKKWILGLIIGLALLAAGIYIFIPATIHLKTNIGIAATRAGLQRMLSNKENIAKWWPGTIKNEKFYYNDLAYEINNNNLPVVAVSIKGINAGLNTSLFLVSIDTDSTHLEWAADVATSYNPVKRFNSNLEAGKLRTDMVHILKKMDSFYSKPGNIYGFDIKNNLVADSFLVSTSGGCTGYPTTQFIYTLIDKLKNYASINAAKQTGYPMLNVSTADSVKYEVKVAIPTDKLLPSSGDIMKKKMLGRGNILVIEVKGGIEITSRAMQQIQTFAEDYGLVSPAIAFYSLVTDRRKEQDTSKWVTKIYYPVM